MGERQHAPRITWKRQHPPPRRRATCAPWWKTSTRRVRRGGGWGSCGARRYWGARLFRTCSPSMQSLEAGGAAARVLVSDMVSSDIMPDRSDMRAMWRRQAARGRRQRHRQNTVTHTRMRPLASKGLETETRAQWKRQHAEPRRRQRHRQGDSKRDTRSHTARSSTHSACALWPRLSSRRMRSECEAPAARWGRTRCRGHRQHHTLCSHRPG